MARQDRALHAGVEADDFQNAARESFDGDQQRPEDGDGNRKRPRGDQRYAVGIVDRHRLGQNLRKDEQKSSHEDRGVKRAAVAEPRDENARREGRRADIGQRIGEQARPDQPVAPGEQPVDKRRAAIAVFFQRVHARARGGGQRGLGAGEECRQEDAQNDGRDRDPQRDRQDPGACAVHHFSFPRSVRLEGRPEPSRRRSTLRRNNRQFPARG